MIVIYRLLFVFVMLLICYIPFFIMVNSRSLEKREEKAASIYIISCLISLGLSLIVFSFWIQE